MIAVLRRTANTCELIRPGSLFRLMRLTVARSGHIHLGQFPLAGSDNRCDQIDGAAGLFSGSGLTGLNQTLLLSRKVHRWRTPKQIRPRSLRASVDTPTRLRERMHQCVFFNNSRPVRHAEKPPFQRHCRNPIHDDGLPARFVRMPAALASPELPQALRSTDRAPRVTRTSLRRRGRSVTHPPPGLSRLVAVLQEGVGYPSLRPRSPGPRA